MGVMSAAALLIVALCCLAVGLTRDPSLIAFVSIACGSIALLAAASLGLWAYGAASLRYSLTPTAVVIHWLGSAEVVPLSDLDGVFSGLRLGSIGKIRGIRRPGYVVGAGRHDNREVLFRTTSLDPQDLTLLVTEHREYAISPQEPAVFRQEVIQRVEQGGGVLPVARSSPLRAAAVAMSDPVSVALLVVGLVLALAVLGQYMVGFERLPLETALHFGSDGAPDVTGPRNALVQIPLLALGGWLVGAVLGLAVSQRSGGAAHLLWLGTAAAQIVLLVAVLRLVP